MSFYDGNGNEIAVTGGGFSVLVAASNSTSEDKAKADYLCTGTNDEIIIQQAVDSLASKGGEVCLATGDYYIDGWNYSTSSYKTAIAIKSGTGRSIRIKGMSFPLRLNRSHDLGHTAVLRVTSTALNALTGNETRTAVIGYNGSSRTYPMYVMDIANLAITLADNQHNVIAIDGKYFSAMLVENVMCGIDTSTYTGTDGAADYNYPVENCIAIRGLDGSNFGAGYRIANCFVFGFGCAYWLNGEHLIAEQLGCRFCNYTYKFGYDNTEGAQAHDLTLINCCHEFCSRYPVFSGVTTRKWSVNMYDYNVEDDSSSQFATVSKAIEGTAGRGRGRIYYTITSTSSWTNISGDFFESGYGENFVTQNTAFPTA